ncbi:iron-sulfur cluster assembly scaffold protein [Patescibacteria group bacterium]
MSDLYQQHILDHYRNPRNKREIFDADVIERGKNASCGDDLTLYLKFTVRTDGSIDHTSNGTGDGEVVEDVAFGGDGCAISTAAASLLTEKIKGMKKEEIRLLTPADIYDMLGVPISAGRSRCALLAYEAIERGLK